MWRDLLGSGFEYGGRGPTYDCYGLAIEVWNRMGKELPNQYQSTDDPGVIHERIDGGHKKHLKRLDGPRAGALVLFRIVPPYVSHIGVMVDDHRFIHIMSKRSVTVDRIDNVYFGPKIVGYYDLP